MLRVTIMGSGTSHGVPMIGCNCAVCTSSDPRDKRTRASIAVQIDGHTLIVDTTPELRLQLVAAGIGHAEAVLYTHSHADHMHGIDDLRRFNEFLQHPVPIYAAQEVLDDIRHRFGYIFAHQYFGGGIPSLDLRPVHGPIDFFGHSIVPIPVWHGATPVLAYRFGPFAYVTDTNNIPPESMEQLRNLEVLVLDALRREPHATHFNFEQALEVVEQLRPRRAYFTHLTHGMAHGALERMLPDAVQPAYDGLRLEFTAWD